MAQFIEFTFNDGTTKIYHKRTKYYTVETKLDNGAYSLHCRKYAELPEFNTKDYTVKEFEGKVKRYN